MYYCFNFFYYALHRGYLGFESSRSYAQHEVTRARPRPSSLEFAPGDATLADIDRLLDDIPDGSTLDENNLEGLQDLINEDDELRDLLGDVFEQRSETKNPTDGSGTQLDLLTRTLRRDDLPTAKVLILLQ